MELQRENEKLRRELERLRGRAQMIDRLLGVASGVIRGRVAGSRTRESKPKGTSDDDDPAGLEMAMRASAEQELRAAGLKVPLSCAVVGASPATVRRWRRRLSEKAPRMARTPPLAIDLQARVASLVRALHGLIGAEALRHAVPGVSRREAARVKAGTLTEMERERKVGTTRVVVTVPGVMRGLDAMHVKTTEGPRWPLFASDAAVPFRTSVQVTERYDEQAVASALERDFVAHRAPMVLRADRWKAHDSPLVAEVLRRHGVLLLHGPAHHPGYDGQLERQNREHRAWLTAAGELDPERLEEACLAMLGQLNSQWPRRSLGWQTSQDLWDARPTVELDRAELRAEVADRAARIRRRAEGRAAVAVMAERLAIEWALTKRGFLRLEPQGRC